MDNYEIAKRFSLLSKLMEVHGENSFKSKTYSIAAYKIEQLTVELQTLLPEKIFSIKFFTGETRESQKCESRGSFGLSRRVFALDAIVGTALICARPASIARVEQNNFFDF